MRSRISGASFCPVIIPIGPGRHPLFMDMARKSFQDHQELTHQACHTLIGFSRDSWGRNGSCLGPAKVSNIPDRTKTGVPFSGEDLHPSVQPCSHPSYMLIPQTGTVQYSRRCHCQEPNSKTLSQDTWVRILCDFGQATNFSLCSKFLTCNRGIVTR